MLLKELAKVLDLNNENVQLFEGDEIERCNCLINYSAMNVDQKVNCDFCEVIKVEMGIVNGVDDKPTLNILIKGCQFERRRNESINL